MNHDPRTASPVAEAPSIEQAEGYDLRATPETIAQAHRWMPLIISAQAFLLAGLACLGSWYAWGLAPNTGLAWHDGLAGLLAATAVGAWLGARSAVRVSNALYLAAWLALAGGLTLGSLPSLVRSLEAAQPLASPLAILVALGMLPTALLLGWCAQAVIEFDLLAVLNRPWRHLSWVWLGLGAAGGVLWVQRMEIPRNGLDNATYALSLGSAILGVWCLHLSKQGLAPATAGSNREEAPPTVASTAVPSRRQMALTLLGGVLMASVGLGWLEALGMLVRRDIYATTALMTIWLAALALGAALSARFVAERSPRWMGIAGLGAAAATLLSLVFAERASYAFHRFTTLLAGTTDAFPLFEAAHYAVALVLTGAGALLLGAFWELCSRAPSAQARHGHSAPRLPLTWLGISLGLSLTGGPVGAALGAKGILQVSLVGLLGLSLLATWESSIWTPLRRGLAVALSLLWLLLARAVSPSFDQGMLATLHEAPAPAAWGALRVAAGDWLTRFHREGPHGSVTVLSHRAEREHDRLLLNDTSATPWLRRPGSIVAAHLAFLAHPAARRVAMLGLSDGVTAASLLSQPLSRLDIVEPRSALWEAVSLLDLDLSATLQDRRIQRLTTIPSNDEPPYDLVFLTDARGLGPRGMAQPTLEGYQSWSRRLHPDGILAQELDLSVLDAEAWRVTIAGLKAVFPALTLWQTQDHRVLAIAARRPLQFSQVALNTFAQRPAVMRDLARAGVTRVEALPLLQMATEDAGHGTDFRVAPHQIRRPTLAYQLPIVRDFGDAALTPYEEDIRLVGSARRDPTHAVHQIWRTSAPLPAPVFEAFDAYQSRNLPLNAVKGMAAKFNREWRRAYPNDWHAIEAEGRRLVQAGQPTQALAVLASPGAAPRSAGAREMLAKLQMTDTLAGWGFLSNAPPERAKEVARIWEARLRAKQVPAGEGWHRLAALAHARGDATAEFQAVERAFAAFEADERTDVPSEVKVKLLVAAGRTALAVGQRDKALQFAERAAALDHLHPEVHRLLQQIARSGSPHPSN
ncbi:MAG: hypothetical protein VKP62_02320 [Candidatus Sericytochromatia bacterium]|nr:hypothetical protein [Candidatus Sericytochromatia bacterium]